MSTAKRVPDRSGWSCEERQGPCRNPYGCHCAEITALRSKPSSVPESDIAFAVERMREGRAVRQRKWPASWHLSIVRPGLMLDVHSGQDVDALPFLAMRVDAAMTPHHLSALDVLSTDWELFTPETEGTA